MRGALTPSRIIAVGALAATLLAIAAIAVVSLVSFGDSAPERAARFAAAWQRGDDRAAAKLSDRPAVALAALSASRKGLDGAKVAVSPGPITERGDRATGPLTVTWQVPGIGRFRYRTTAELVRAGDAWAVHWTAQTVHPRLEPATRLGTAVTRPDRARIIDRNGRALVSERAVTDIAVAVGKVKDPAATAQELAPLTGVRAADLQRTIRQAPDGQTVPVVTLRHADFVRVRVRLKAIDGVVTTDHTAPLAPTKGFARALLGVVGPATAEQVKRSRGAVRAGDAVGQFGLQARFDARLRGTVTRRVVIRSRATGKEVATLMTRRGGSGQPLRTTLDRRVQVAAEAALGKADRRAAVVALQPSTGDLLAVANRPYTGAYDRALEGLYPPGSTFKVVSTAALLRDGFSVDQVVPCPATRNVGGRVFRNFEGGAAGSVPFRVDFAQSCNTAFVSLAKRLEPGALTTTARDFGLGEVPKLAVPAATAKVPPETGLVGRAAMMIGQARIAASPLAMAGVAGTVAAGRWRAPRLLRSDPRRSGPQLGPQQLATLRELMRSVVTMGTGTALATVNGEPAGKSGTAEFGQGTPPKTHAWFIALRGDIAVAVLVEGGSSGAEVAAPIAAHLYSSLDQSAESTTSAALPGSQRPTVAR